MPKPKYSILCYIINGYECVHEVKEKDPDCEYVLVTDDPNLKSSTWKVIYDESLLGMSVFDRCYAIRFNLFKYVTSDICIYIDANIEVKRPLAKLVKLMDDGGYDMCLMPHPLRSLFAPEYNAWLAGRNYPLAQAEKFFKMLADSHYDLTYRGLFQGCFKIVRRGKLNSDFEALSMAFLKYLGTETAIERLDQTVYTYVLNVWFNQIKVLPVSEQILRSSYMQWYWHNGNPNRQSSPNMNIFYDITKPDIKWMFNKQVECLYLKD